MGNCGKDLTQARFHQQWGTYGLPAMFKKTSSVPGADPSDGAHNQAEWDSKRTCKASGGRKMATFSIYVQMAEIRTTSNCLGLETIARNGAFSSTTPSARCSKLATLPTLQQPVSDLDSQREKHEVETRLLSETLTLFTKSVTELQGHTGFDYQP